jgi:hypothetical protein
MSARFTRRAKALTFGGLATLGLAVVAQLAVTPAATSADSYTVPLHQDTPITNSGYGDKGDCTGSPAQWGWHFVLPSNDSSFVTLTTTFENAGTIVTTVFGPPSAQHAYVYTATDDTLQSASAEVSGGDVDWFNLSHVCTGTTVEETPSPSPSETVSETPSATPSETVSETPSATPSETVSETPSATPSETVSETPSSTPSETVSETPTPEVSDTQIVTESPSESESPEVLPTEITKSATPSASVKGEKVVKPVVSPTRLPSTGTPFPVLTLVLLGVGLMAAGVISTVAGEPRTAGTTPRHRR